MSNIKKIRVNNVDYDIQDNVSGFATTDYVNNHHDTSKADKADTYTKSETDIQISNYHDTSKVDKINGKGLSSNDYTTVEKNKLANLENYDDTLIKSSIQDLEENKVNKSELSDMATKSWVQEYINNLDGDDEYY